MAEEVWQRRRGIGGVAEEVWQRRRGRGGVADKEERGRGRANREGAGRREMGE